MTIKCYLHIGKAVYSSEYSNPAYVMAENDPLEIAVQTPPEGLYATLECEGKKRTDVLAPGGLICVQPDLLSPGRLLITLYRMVGGRAVETWTADPLTIIRLPGEYKVTTADVERNAKIANLIERISSLEKKVDDVTLSAPKSV